MNNLKEKIIDLSKKIVLSPFFEISMFFIFILVVFLIFILISKDLAIFEESFYSTIMLAWSTIVLGSLLTHFLVNRYEEIKDKIKIKEKLIFEINQMWQSGSRLLAEAYSASDNKRLMEFHYKYTDHADILEGYLDIYSKQGELLKELEKIKQKFQQGYENLLKEDDNKDENKIREDYLNHHDEFSGEMRNILKKVGRIKIEYRT